MIHTAVVFVVFLNMERVTRGSFGDYETINIIFETAYHTAATYFSC